MSGLPVLSLLIFLPLAGALAVSLLPSSRPGVIRAAALGVSLATFALSLLMLPGLAGIGSTGAEFAYVEQASWIPAFGITYHLGVDGLSGSLVVLTTLLSWICILASFGPIQARVKEYFVSFLILETGMLGVFLALDLFLFYIFWEVVLVPMYLIIGIWGGADRIYATIKFVLYTLVGSLLMLVAILATAFAHQAATGSWEGAFDLLALRGSVGDPTLQVLAFGAFALAFAIKVPMFPFHTWLPDAHVQAPTAGSVILAGVLLKLGGYGFIRFAVPLFPYGAQAFAPIMVALSVVAIIYGALVAIVQTDLKKLIAYSSVSHMGFVTLGIFSFNQQGVDGAILQMLNHGLITSGLFLLVGIGYERTHDREIAKMGGWAARTPVYAALFGFFLFASVGLPGLSGFAGEFLVLLGAFLASPMVAGAAAIVMVLGAVYLLWMYQRVFTGPLSPFLAGLGTHLTDVTPTEILTLAPLAAMIVTFGVLPSILTSSFAQSVGTFLLYAASGVQP